MQSEASRGLPGWTPGESSGTLNPSLIPSLLPHFGDFSGRGGSLRARFGFTVPDPPFLRGTALQESGPYPQVR